MWEPNPRPVDAKVGVQPPATYTFIIRTKDKKVLKVEV
jgi:hypothetical protein